MAASARTLARLHRVRTLQLNLTRAEEARAANAHASEASLHARIEVLAHGASGAGDADALTLGASAYYRDRLWTSAAAAAERVRIAEARMAEAGAATRTARLDQSAVEKLIARSDAAATLKAIRAMEDYSPVRRNRHDPC